MSTKAQLDQVCLALRRLWTDKDGSVAILRGRKGDALYRVCCGRMSNPNFMAERCRVWRGDTQVYCGPLSGLALFKALDTGRVCTAEVTTTRLIARRKSGRTLCCGRRCAQCGKCRYGNAEQNTV